MKNDFKPIIYAIAFYIASAAIANLYDAATVILAMIQGVY